MAFDGFVVAALVKEMNDKLLGGRLYKIAQPEDDELFITIKNSTGSYCLQAQVFRLYIYCRITSQARLRHRISACF